MKTRALSLLLAALLLILPLLASCGTQSPAAESSEEETVTEAPSTEAPSTTEEPTQKPEEPVLDPNASVYSGTPDTSWFTGDKTEYILTSADQLVGFHSLRSSTFGYEGITVKLDCDVIINQGTVDEILASDSKHNWKELNSAYLFKGTFDGQGHTISGVYMQLGGSGIKSMFGGVGGNATLKNFNLINSYFGGPSAADKKAMSAIASKIAGSDANVTFSNISINAVLKEGTAKFDRVGGLIGQIEESLTVTIENCHFNGSISIGGDYAGGLIGYASGAALNVTMKNCTNSGSISATNYAGGLAGLLGPAVAGQDGCKNYGVITAEHYAGDLNGRLSMMVDPANGARPTDIPEGTTALRIMSFNVQTSLPKSNGTLTDAAKNRIEAVRQEILFYEPDLLGLQEDNQTWIMNLNPEGYNVIQDGTASSSSERCAIYYKKGLKLLSSGTVWLTNTRTSVGAGLTYEDLSTPGSKYYMTPEELAIIGVRDTSDLKASKNTYVDQTTGKTVVLTDETYVLLDTRKMTWGVFDINGQTVIYIKKATWSSRISLSL